VSILICFALMVNQYDLLVRFNDEIKQEEIVGILRTVKVKSVKIVSQPKNIYEIVVESNLNEKEILKKIREIKGVKHVEVNRIYN
jgi:hypothetical protein